MTGIILQQSSNPEAADLRVCSETDSLCSFHAQQQEADEWITLAFIQMQAMRKGERQSDQVAGSESFCPPQIQYVYDRCVLPRRGWFSSLLCHWWSLPCSWVSLWWVMVKQANATQGCSTAQLMIFEMPNGGRKKNPGKKRHLSTSNTPTAKLSSLLKAARNSNIQIAQEEIAS